MALLYANPPSRLLKNYCGARLRRCAVLGILMYIEYIPVPARRAPRIQASSLRFSAACCIIRRHLTNKGFYNYIVAMEKDLDALSDKVAEMVKIVAKLREENQQLRQQLAAKSDENTRLSEKISVATTRLEAVLAKIPEKET
jgi:cell division protein ZapB